MRDVFSSVSEKMRKKKQIAECACTGAARLLPAEVALSEGDGVMNIILSSLVHPNPIRDWEMLLGWAIRFLVFTV